MVEAYDQSGRPAMFTELYLIGSKYIFIEEININESRFESVYFFVACN